MFHMFCQCSSLISLNITNFDTSKVTDMSYMFFNCKKLKEINLSNFDTSQVIKMDRMFSYCKNLTSLNLNNFNTSKVDDMNHMFSKCLSLNSLNLSNFDTSNVKDMNAMFANCFIINSLDISSFDTSHISNMSGMFYNCSRLSILDLSNFNTSNSTEMNHMFFGCASLNYINLSNFDTSNVKRMDNMFYNCSSLTSLDISNFNTSEVYKINNMFYNCINLSILNLSNFEISNVFKDNDIEKMFYNCSSLKILNLSNFDISNINALQSMFNGCQNSEYINFTVSNSNGTIKDIFLLTHPNLVICEANNNDIFIDSNLLTKINIYCDYNKINIIVTNNYFCYLENSSLYDNNICTICDEKFFIDENGLINISNNYFINCIDSINSGGYYINFSTIIYNEIKNRTEIIQHIIDDLIKDFNMTELDNGEDKKSVDKNKVIILTSTNNQKNNEEKNNITMNLGECENKLKNDYNISYNNSLYILQIITEEEGMKIPKIEYEVYYPLNGNNITKLNLTTCKDTKIEISIKVKINDSLDKYNPKSDYYNDICYTSTSESGTDISLKDRKNEFIDNNMSLCEENCDLIEYNRIKEKAKCSCDIKLSIPSDYEIQFNKNEFFKSFIDIKNMFNLNIIKCYKIVFKIKRLIKNHGFLIVGSIIILYFITLIIFSSHSYDKIKEEIFNIIFAIKINANPIKKNKNKKGENKHFNKKKNNKKLLKSLTKKFKDGNETIKCTFNNKMKNKSKQVTQNISRKLLLNQINKFSIIKETKNTDANKILQKKDFELNSLDYIEAIKLDHRNYCEYYISLIKYNHPILFSFIPFEDYNSYIIKLFLFFFSFYLDIAINALFFTDDTMHKIYSDKGKFDLLYQIPQILYSTLISRVFDTFIRSLALSQNNIIELKQVRVKKRLKARQNKLLRILKIKFILFFISSFIFLICFGYYITCFCGIYINTQIHLIKDSIMSLFLSLLIPFIMYLLPGIFRIPSLRVMKPNRIILYKVSQFIENWFC